MNKRFILLTAAVIAFSAAAGAASFSDAPGGGAGVPSEANAAKGSVIVALRGQVSARYSAGAEGRRASIMSRADQAAPEGASAREAFPELSQGAGRSFALVESTTQRTDELMKSMKQSPNVAAVYPNDERYITALSEYATDDPFNEVDAISYWQSDVTGAGRLIAEEGSGTHDVVAAVVDTGIKYDHPDLQSKLANVGTLSWNSKLSNAAGAWFTSDKSRFGDGPFRIGPRASDGSFLPSYDTLRYQNGSAAYTDPALIGDIHSHGSHVAGMIAAVRGNGIGVAGVGGSCVKLLPVNVFNISGMSASDSTVLAGLEYIINVNSNSDIKGKIRVVNMSLGGWSDGVSSSDLKNSPYYTAFDKLRKQGVIICIAAGNDGTNLSGASSQDYYPAVFRRFSELDNLIVVGSASYNAGSDPLPSYFSNYSDPENNGSYMTDLFAPGDELLSTVPVYGTTGKRIVWKYSSGAVLADKDQTLKDPVTGYPGYIFLKGTSMASPAAAGAVAQLAAMLPEDTSYTEIRDLIFASANSNICRRGVSAFGLLNVWNAWQRSVLPLPVKDNGTAEAGNLYTWNALSSDVQGSAAASLLTHNPNGYIYLTDAGLAEKTQGLEDLLKKTSACDVIHILSLPASLGVSVDSSGFCEVRMHAAGAHLSALSDNLVLGAVSGDSLLYPLTRRYDAGAAQDGSYVITDAGSGKIMTSGESLDSDKDYIISFCIKDDGPFDLSRAQDGSNRVLIAPVSAYVLRYQSSKAVAARNGNSVTPDVFGQYVYTEADSQSDSGTGTGGLTASSSGGSSGCSAGFPFSVLFAAIPTAFVLKRRKHR